MTHYNSAMNLSQTGREDSKKALKCDNCGVTMSECRCQSGCCGGACPNCTF